MARKRVPSDTEIESLAARFLALWKPGDVIRPWLRQHADLLFGLVHDGWSWAAIARALTQAGITYQTGKAWTADWLQSDFYRARTPLKGYARKRIERIATDIQPVSFNAGVEQFRPTDPLASSSDGQTLTEQATPKFKAFSLKAHEQAPAPSPAEAQEREAIRIRMFGPNGGSK